MKIELECKIPISGREEIAGRLASLGAHDKGDVHERNWCFDTEDERLKGEQMLLRIRTVGGGEAALFTVKLPSEEGKFKSRQEIEMKAESAEDGIKLLNALGYEITWFYEKRRHHWTYRNCEIALDLLPEIGCFIEIEGESEESISAICHELSIDPSGHVDGNYRSLFAEHCSRNGTRMRDMRFDD
ncbi:MAG: class IV adenylate cyclase [Planctomycetes bacterium]|nr:class IV adenylate cyclase [Planctomycetota bacterium]